MLFGLTDWLPNNLLFKWLRAVTGCAVGMELLISQYQLIQKVAQQLVQPLGIMSQNDFGRLDIGLGIGKARFGMTPQQFRQQGQQAAAILPG